MIVLGIETSGAVGSLALRVGGRCVEERVLSRLGHRHAQRLIPEAVRLLAGHGLSLRAVEAVAVSVGPGSFTGLRVGVTFAKTLCYAAGAQLAAVETFRAIAENTPAARNVIVLADGQRAGRIVGRYRREFGGGFERVGDPTLAPTDELPALFRPGDLLTGMAERIEPLPSGLFVAPVHARFARASVVARLGEGAVERGDVADAWTLEPLYVRKSGAEEKADAARR